MLKTKLIRKLYCMARTRGRKRSEGYCKNRGGECSKAERLAHCLRGDFECPYCGCDLREARVVSMDHVVAQVWGGVKSDTNIVACCGSCNSSKKHKMLADFAAGRGDEEMQARVRRILRRNFPKYLQLARKILSEPGDVPESTDEEVNKMPKNDKASGQPKTYPDDGAMLEDALDHLAALSLLLEDVAEAIKAGEPDVEGEDGARVPIARALDKASLSAVGQVAKVRSQRAIRDGTLDDDTTRVLDALEEEDAQA